MRLAFKAILLLALLSIAVIFFSAQSGKASLGVVVDSLGDERARALGLPDNHGIIVRGVYPGGAGDLASLQVGDVLFEIQGKPIASNEEYDLLRERWKIGSEIRLGIIRGGERFERVARLIKAPSAEEYVAYLKPYAQSDHPWALRNLGAALVMGKGVAQDEGAGCARVYAAAEKGDMDAQYLLGCFLHEGTGTPKDLAESVRWLRQAASQGQASAWCQLALCYQLGEGVEKDSSEVVRALREAIARGDMRSQVKLGLVLGSEGGVEHDEGEAHRLFKVAAERNDPDGQYFLGQTFELGIGTQQDLSAARSAYLSALGNHHPKAAEAVRRLDGSLSPPRRPQQRVAASSPPSYPVASSYPPVPATPTQGPDPWIEREYRRKQEQIRQEERNWNTQKNAQDAASAAYRNYLWTR